MPEVIKIGITEKNNQKIQEVKTVKVIANQGIVGDRHFKEFNDPFNRYTTLKRSTLLEFLFKNVPKNQIKFNSNITKIENVNNFRITLNENTHEEFDYLIIADGIFSKTKSLILNEKCFTTISNRCTKLTFFFFNKIHKFR